MKIRTIVDIMATAQSYNNEIINGMPPTVLNGSTFEFPNGEEIRKYREQKQKEYEQWLDTEIEESGL